ncbi:hypothetical protein SGLAM104S_10077 [Streptomyces glaucescens]
MDADQRTGVRPEAVRVTRVVSPLRPAVTSSCCAPLAPAPVTLTTSTETSGRSPRVRRPPGWVLALPAFS